MKIKVSEATDKVLDYLVATCEGEETYIHKGRLEARWTDNGYSPSTYWAQGGPIIEREGLYLKARNDAKEWASGALSVKRQDGKPGPLYYGPTPLIAAMRCYVASKLGDTAEVPEELL